jgi:hypothetical protein
MEAARSSANGISDRGSTVSDPDPSADEASSVCLVADVVVVVVVVIFAP